MRALSLGLDLFSRAVVQSDPPENLALGGTHSVAENAVLGHVVGALTGDDPASGTLIWSMVDGDDRFGVVASNVVLEGVLDYETATSHDITVRATSSASGASADLPVTITVTDIAETPPDDPLPEGEDEPDDADNFDVPPYTVEAEGTVKLAGKKKANGSTAKFIHNVIADVPLEAGMVYTMEYDPDFTQMTEQGVLAMVGFMFKAGNDFYLVGLRGDGSTGIHAYEVQGDNLWNQVSGFTVDDGGAAANGTQAGPNWIQLETSANGTTITLRTSGDDGDSWDDEYTARAATPFGNVSAVTAWGPGAFFHNSDDGPYSIAVNLWTAASAELWTPAAGGLGSNMSLWFDASDAATVTHASNAISQWNDKSGQNLHVTQTTESRKPTYTSASQNGLNAITFDGSADWLSKTTGVSPNVPRQTQTTFFVARPTTDGVTPLYWTTNGSTVAGVCYCGRGVSGAVRYQGNTNNYANVAQSGAAAWHNYSGYILAAKRELFIDGVLGNTNSVAETLATAPTQIWFGSSGGVAFYGGVLGEFVQYNGTLSQADRERVEGYLAHKWGLASLLDAGHPYKNSAPTV